MAQATRVAAQFDITCSAEKFNWDFKNNMGRLVQLVPENIKGYKIVHGNEFGNGAAVVWNYELRTPMTVKLRQDTNDADKTFTFTVLGGDILEKFKSFMVKLEVERGAAKWSIEFEKLNPNVPNPNEYLELYKKITRGFDAYLGKA